MFKSIRHPKTRKSSQQFFPKLLFSFHSLFIINFRHCLLGLYGGCHVQETSMLSLFQFSVSLFSILLFFKLCFFLFYVSSKFLCFAPFYFTFFKTNTNCHFVCLLRFYVRFLSLFQFFKTCSFQFHVHSNFPFLCEYLIHILLFSFLYTE